VLARLSAALAGRSVSHHNEENDMRSFFLKCLVSLFFFTIFGCVTVPQTSGTVANARLQSDVMGMIGILESAAGGSKQPTLVSASGAGKSGSTVIEHWIVDSNGKKVTYEVKLTPSPRGGVDYRAGRLPSQ